MKAQAAMEFIMTYSWAIIVVLIAIAALAYFGVLNPGKFLPSSCILVPGLACEGFKVDATGPEHIRLDIRNGMGQELYDFSITVLGDINTGTCSGDSSPSLDLNDGDKVSYTISCTDPPSSKKKFQSDLILTYTDPSGIQHSKTGKIIAEVEPN